MKILFNVLAEFKYKSSDKIYKEHAKAALGILKELVLRQDLHNITWNHLLFRDVQQMLELKSRNDTQPQAGQHVIWLDPPSEGDSVNGKKRKLEQTQISSEDPPAKRRNIAGAIAENGDENNFTSTLANSTGNLTEEEELSKLLISFFSSSN